MRAINRILAVALIGGWAASASAISLFDLSHGATLLVGDKLFSDFSFSSIGAGAPGPTTINVTGVGTGAPNDLFGICIQGGLVTSSSLDVGISYHVAVVDGIHRISDIHQAFNLTAQGNGGTIGIGETVFDHQGGNQVAQSSVGFVFGVTDANDPPGELLQGDQLFVNPALVSVFVTKDINLTAAQGGQVGATIIYQRFSQVGVPDGGSTLLLLSAVAGGLGLARRRWKNA
jgi:hypothetical protein